MSLVVRDLALDYPGPVRALDGVDLELESGSLMGVLGPNGAGKSTLIRLLAGLIPPTRGAIELDGRPLTSLGARERARRIARVPQDLEVLPEITVGHFVLGGRYAHLGTWRRPGSSDTEAVERALADADVSELSERLLSHISGGQRQRVLVARALAQEAPLLLVDEPTSSLDPEHQVGVFRLLRDLADGGRSVLVVTHDLNLASQFATELVLLDAGRVVARGTAEEILCPAVLSPVYGPYLRFGTFPDRDTQGARPFVLPWSPPG